MIFHPVVSSGGAGSSAWKEVDREYIAEHYRDPNANFLVAVFTTEFPNQPMIIPASNVFCIGRASESLFSNCSYNVYNVNQGYKFYDVFSALPVPQMSDGEGSNFYLQLDDALGENDIIPEGWSIKYYIYEG